MTSTYSPIRKSKKVLSAFEDELKEKNDRLNALNIELNLDEKDTPVMDTEPEQENEQPEKRTQDKER